jgi:hypothetical protein
LKHAYKHGEPDAEQNDFNLKSIEENRSLENFYGQSVFGFDLED